MDPACNVAGWAGIMLDLCLDVGLPIGLQVTGQARSRGGGGSGGGRTNKDFVPPFSNFVPPFSNFVPPFSNFVPPFSNFVPLFSNLFHPLAILFHPWNMWMTSRGQCPRGGGCLWMSKSGGVFQIDDVTRTMSKVGGAPGVPPIQVQTPPPTWLAGYGPAGIY